MTQGHLEYKFGSRKLEKNKEIFNKRSLVDLFFVNYGTLDNFTPECLVFNF